MQAVTAVFSLIKHASTLTTKYTYRSLSAQRLSERTVELCNVKERNARFFQNNVLIQFFLCPLHFASNIYSLSVTPFLHAVFFVMFFVLKFQ
jgi:hypothetical protein